ncbi:MAG TPA: cytidine deaminase [Planctomycetaceae bacterium]|nr:cytidine deaminase [Planctomycetaceae bacterium]
MAATNQDEVEIPQALIEAAVAARQHAYAPYSGYQVGAAILSQDGTVTTGCNVENASYGLSNCAERTAIFKLVSEGGDRRLKLVVIATKDGGSPCGACRQVLAEFGRDFRIASYAVETKKTQVWTMAELLPDAFSLED